MITIIVIAHSEIASGMVSCVEHIIAKRVSNLHVIPVKKSEDIERIMGRAEAFINQMSHDEQVLILTDLFGATPSNLASRLVKHGKIEMITGLNMPMLLRAISYINYDLHICIEKALEGAKNGIVYLDGENM